MLPQEATCSDQVAVISIRHRAHTCAHLKSTPALVPIASITSATPSPKDRPMHTRRQPSPDDAMLRCPRHIIRTCGSYSAGYDDICCVCLGDARTPPQDRCQRKLVYLYFTTRYRTRTTAPLRLMPLSLWPETTWPRSRRPSLFKACQRLASAGRPTL